jgi:hypothetical protein
MQFLRIRDFSILTPSTDTNKSFLDFFKVISLPEHHFLDLEKIPNKVKISSRANQIRKLYKGDVVLEKIG